MSCIKVKGRGFPAEVVEAPGPDFLFEPVKKLPMKWYSGARVEGFDCHRSNLPILKQVCFSPGRTT